MVERSIKYSAFSVIMDLLLIIDSYYCNISVGCAAKLPSADVQSCCGGHHLYHGQPLHFQCTQSLSKVKMKEMLDEAIEAEKKFCSKLFFGWHEVKLPLPLFLKPETHS